MNTRLPGAFALACMFFLAPPLAAQMPPLVGADEVVSQTTEALLNALDADRQGIAGNPSRVFELVEDIVLPHVDTEAMARWILGRHWRRATPEQQARFEQAFRILLLRTYGTALQSYAGQPVRYLGTRADRRAQRSLVRMEIARESAPPLMVAFAMYERGGRWLVYDLRIEGVSLVQNYRRNFSTLLRQRGLEELIVDLEGHNRRGRSAAAS